MCIYPIETRHLQKHLEHISICRSCQCKKKIDSFRCYVVWIENERVIERYLSSQFFVVFQPKILTWAWIPGGLLHRIFILEAKPSLTKSSFNTFKKQQTKMLVMCQRFGDLFLFGLVWSTIRTNISKVGLKSWLITCSSNVTLSLPSYTVSAL